MDQRQTFADTRELLTILTNLYTKRVTVALLIDQNGLSRISGFIELLGESSFTVFENHTNTASKHRILLHEVVAVNGIFHSDYSEC